MKEFSAPSKLCCDGGHILLDHCILDAFGHVSARHPARPGCFLLARRLPPKLVRPDDIRSFNADSGLVDPDGTPVFLERSIHDAIYAVRPDVQAVVHSHSAAMIGFSIVRNRPLQPVCHTCGFLGQSTPVFEIRDVAGDACDMFVSDPRRAAAAAEHLGQGNVVLMRGHGSTVVGPSVRQAIYRAIYAETNARIQVGSSAMGEVTAMTAQEASAVERTAAVQVERSWEYWCSTLLPSAPRPRRRGLVATPNLSS